MSTSAEYPLLAGAGFYFDGQTMYPVKCQDRLGSYNYAKQGGRGRRSETLTVNVRLGRNLVWKK